MSKFKVGDKVVITASHLQPSESWGNGSTGTICDIWDGLSGVSIQPADGTAVGYVGRNEIELAAPANQFELKGYDKFGRFIDQAYVSSVDEAKSFVEDKANELGSTYTLYEMVPVAEFNVARVTTRVVSKL